MQHDVSHIVNFWHEIKNSTNWCATNSITFFCHNPKISKFEKPYVIFFSISKRQVHIFSMSATTMQSLRLIAYEVWKELIIQTCHPVLTITQKFSEFEKAVLL